MTTLGSWIDNEALAQVIRELCPDAAPEERGAVQPPVDRSVATPLAVNDDTESGRIREALGSGIPFDDDDDASVPLETLPISNSAPARPALVDRLAAVKQRAQRSGLIGGHAKAGIAPPFQPFTPPADTIAVRLEALMHWIGAQCQSLHVCLADSRGESLTSAEAPAGLPVTSTLLADALHRSQTEGGIVTNHALHSALDDGQVLTVIAVPTTEGLFSIAVVRNAPLSHRDIHHCRDGFYTAIEARAPAEAS